MSLLTKEQLQIVNGIKAMIADYDYKTDQIRGLFDLVSIIDDLQARAPKQYTEQELREAARADGVKFNYSYSNGWLGVFEHGFQRGAEFVGALKAEP